MLMFVKFAMLRLNPESIPCFFIIRVSASWQQPSCTSSFWHRSAGSSPRPGSPTWQWQERFGRGSSASAFCVLAGVRKHRYNQDLSYFPSYNATAIFSVYLRMVFFQPTVWVFEVLINTVGWLDLHSAKLFVVKLLFFSQALWGLGNRPAFSFFKG